MIEKETIFILIISLCFSILTFLIGYIIGKISNFNGVYDTSNNKNKLFTSQKNNDSKSKIIIDDSKFVLDIKTDSLEKKYDSLGDIKKTEEKIDQSISKLKQLKR